MKKIIKGEIYLYDIMGKMLQRETGSTYSVLVLSKIGIFGSKYKCRSIQNDNLIICDSKYLFRLPPDVDLHVFIRYPDDVPIINEKDLELLVNIENSEIKELLIKNSLYERFKLLSAKLNFYSKIKRGDS